ncbi:MAG: capsule biosynthesis protein CapA, partial [Gammaproteobacteria bacterium]|nr:capsule biosynthesis protein CapA [Gammaproteobacteria bacterium]
MSHSIPYRTGSQRSFLFLQGCTSPFFARLGAALRNSGHSVYRINFNTGDACYWGWQPAWNFSRPVEELADFLEKKFTTIGFSDLIMLGDTRPVHRQAIPVAIRHEARLHILEEGYL